jgi:hypothetical protein
LQGKGQTHPGDLAEGKAEFEALSGYAKNCAAIGQADTMPDGLKINHQWVNF